MKVWGCLYIIVGVFAGWSSFRSMMAGVNGAPESWWPAFAFGAATLLVVEGIRLCVPKIQTTWLILLTGAIPLSISTIFIEWPLRIWVFSAALSLIEALILKASAVTRRDGISAFVSCLVLVAALANTTIHLFSDYWSGWWNATSQWTLTQIAGFMLPALIPWSILLAMLLHTINVMFGNWRKKAADPTRRKM
jgi:hypothetical protein